MSVSSNDPGMDLLISYIDGYKATLTLKAATELKIFDLIEGSKEPVTAEGLSSANQWNLDRTERLLNALAGLKVISKTKSDNGQYVFTSNEAGHYLTKDGGFAAYISMNTEDHGDYSKIPEEVRSAQNEEMEYPKWHDSTNSQEDTSHGDHQHGHGHGHGDHGHGHHDHGSFHDNPEAMQEIYVLMDTFARTHAPSLLRAFDLSCHKSFVDLGGGSGVFTYAMKKAYPKMAVTLYEQESVLTATKDKFWDKEAFPDVNFVAGDFMNKDIPQADLYLLSMVLHDWRDDQARILLKRVSDSLAPGGGLLVFEKCLNDDKAGPMSANMWDLMVMSGCSGRLRSGQEYIQLLESCGFTNIQIKKSAERVLYDVIYARKS